MKNVAVFGAGRIGRIHATNLASLPGVRVKYVSDAWQTAADDLAHELRAEASSIETALADPSVEAVIVCSPTSTHIHPHPPTASSLRVQWRRANTYSVKSQWISRSNVRTLSPKQ